MNECIEHSQKGTAGGYGKTRRRVAEGVYKTLWLHRLAYEKHHGPIPEGMEVRHKCDNRRCINPEHLEIGTHADNMGDMAQRGRANRKLSPEDVKLIRQLYDRNGPALAKRFGVTTARIYQLLKDSE